MIWFLFRFSLVDRERRSAAHFPLRQTWRFQFHFTNIPFLRSYNYMPAYGVFILRLIRYTMACSSYECFIPRAARLSCKLRGQRCVRERLKSSLSKFYGRYGDIIRRYEVSFYRVLHNILGNDHIKWHPHLIRHNRPWAAIYPPPPGGILQGYIFLKAYTKC